jgi:hypothetical protein
MKTMIGKRLVSSFEFVLADDYNDRLCHRPQIIQDSMIRNASLTLLRFGRMTNSTFSLVETELSLVSLFGSLVT